MKWFVFCLPLFAALIFSSCSGNMNEAFPFLNMAPVEESSGQSASSATAITEFKPYTARFSIFTNGTRRTFTDAMYLEQSPRAYLTDEVPNEIYVEQPSVTWREFFDTLPFSISNECLVTGTGQKFCTGDGGELQFFVNGEEVSQALDLEINPGDELVVRFE